MIRHNARLAMGLLAVLLSAAAAPAKAGSWTLGFGWGEADYGVTVGDFDDGSIRTGRVDSNELGWKLWAGYRFNRHLALEAGYVDLLNDFDAPTFDGVSDGGGSRFVSLPDGPVSVGVAPSGYFLDGVGSVALGGSWSALGRAGIVFWEAETATRDLIGEVLSRDHGTALHLGAGIERRWQSGLAVRGEYEVFSSVSDLDIDLFTVGVAYSFR